MQNKELNTCKQDIYYFLHIRLPTTPRLIEPGILSFRSDLFSVVSPCPPPLNLFRAETDLRAKSDSCGRRTCDPEGGFFPFDVTLRFSRTAVSFYFPVLFCESIPCSGFLLLQVSYRQSFLRMLSRSHSHSGIIFQKNTMTA